MTDAEKLTGKESGQDFEREKWLKDYEFQREKWIKENEYRDLDNKAKDRELAIKEGELEVRHKEAKRTIFSNPLALALVGATVAAIANVWVAYHNGSEQRALETVKADSGRDLERQKAEDDRIVSAINGDPNVASARLRFLAETHLITDETLRKFILDYIQTQQVTIPPPPPSGVPLRRVTIESGWLEGGHNQQEVCEQLLAGVRAQNPGKSVSIANTTEEGRKDFLGHVTYNYHCDFEIH